MSIRRTPSTLAAAAASLALLASGQALAQIDQPGPYDPLGIRAGNFFIFPQLTVSGVYNDNIRASSTDREDDFIFVLSPRINILSNFPRHRLNFGLGGDAGFHVDESDENFYNAFVFTDGRLDVTRDIDMTGLLRYDRITEERESPEEVGAITKRTFYHRNQARLGYNHRFARFHVGLLGDVRRFDFREVFGVGSDRDRWEFGTRLRTGMALTPGISSFVQGTLDWRRYDDELDRNDFKRNSRSWGVAGGFAFDITALLDGDIFAGYSRRSFSEPTFEDTSGLTAGGSLTWLPTRLTTVRLALARDFVATTREGASSNFQTDADLSVDHDLLSNVRLSGRVGYTRDAFRGTERRDNRYRASAGVSYLINRNFSVGASYGFTYRDSNQPNLDFNRNVVSISLTGRL